MSDDSADPLYFLYHPFETRFGQGSHASLFKIGVRSLNACKDHNNSSNHKAMGRTKDGLRDCVLIPI